MSTPTTPVDQFQTTDDVDSIPHMKIQSNNVWFNPNLVVYPEELKMMGQRLNDFLCLHALSSSVCNSDAMMESKGTKKLLKKQFIQILHLPAAGPFEEPTPKQEPIQLSTFESEGNVGDNDKIMHDNTSVSPRRDVSVKLNIEETRNSDVTVNTSNVDTNIKNSETPSTSIHDSNTLIPPKGPTSKSHP
ncbi:unnamed protein product [Lactuca virosa]|uniref:Uncharacterized protein n=1 Tax=Lactuca virosa TaxID=75947 RepID=A0AAU9M0B7_9ASTR|nr:unnamed protein product [Lactuca virosa]